MIRSTQTKENTYHGYPLQDYNGPGAGFYEDILTRLIDRLAFMLGKYDKCLVVRLVVKYPKVLNAAESNHCFQYFMEEYRRKLKLHNFAPQYVWVRELHHARNQHYHLVLFLNAKEIQFFNKTTEARLLWSKAIRKYNPTVRYIPPRLVHKDAGNYNGAAIRHGLIVTAKNQALKQEAIRWCSYVAKINTKGSAPYDCNDFHASQLPKKQEETAPCNSIVNNRSL